MTNKCKFESKCLQKFYVASKYEKRMLQEDDVLPRETEPPYLSALYAKHKTQGAKKVTFTACHSGKLKLTFTSPGIISTSPKNVLMSRLISQFFCNLNSAKDFNCPSGQLITEFTSPMAKSTSPRLSDTTFFAR